jgi:hypothetical protein
MADELRAATAEFEARPLRRLGDGSALCRDAHVDPDAQSQRAARRATGGGKHGRHRWRGTPKF